MGAVVCRGIPPVPAYGVDVVAAAVLVVLAQVAAAGRKFPFCLGGQAELPAGQLVQLDDELMALGPRHALDRQIVVHPEPAGMNAHHGPPQVLADLGLADAES